jgi:hypothetical protein
MKVEIHQCLEQRDERDGGDEEDGAKPLELLKPTVGYTLLIRVFAFTFDCASKRKVVVGYTDCRFVAV